MHSVQMVELAVVVFAARLLPTTLLQLIQAPPSQPLVLYAVVKQHSYVVQTRLLLVIKRTIHNVIVSQIQVEGLAALRMLTATISILVRQMLIVNQDGAVQSRHAVYSQNVSRLTCAQILPLLLAPSSRRDQKVLLGMREQVYHLDTINDYVEASVAKRYNITMLPASLSELL